MTQQQINNEAQWHEERAKGIGGSEAAAIIGLSPWCSNVELWRRKTGRHAAPDISNNAAVAYGHDAEPLIRRLFALDYVDNYDEAPAPAEEPAPAPVVVDENTGEIVEEALAAADPTADFFNQEG